jgi:hypothetical protein
MCRDACQRDRMAEAWQRAIFHPEATHSRVMHEVFVPTPRIPSHPVLRHLLRARGGWLGRLRTWLLERKVARIAHVVLELLRGLRLIDPGLRAVLVTTGKETIRVRLAGASCREETLFVAALREVFDPLQSPRYMLVNEREEFAVPRAFAERKDRAETFARLWRRQVGKARLVFTHTAEGKRRLLRAKERHLAAKQAFRTESRLRWG